MSNEMTLTKEQYEELINKAEKYEQYRKTSYNAWQKRERRRNLIIKLSSEHSTCPHCKKKLDPIADQITNEVVMKSLQDDPPKTK